MNKGTVGYPGPPSPPADTGLLLPMGKYALVAAPNNGTVVPTLNTEYCYGVLLAAQLIDAMTVYLQSVGSGDSVVRLGVRADDGSEPGATVAYETSLATASGTGWKTVPFSYDHPGGIFWFSYVTQGTTAGTFQHCAGVPVHFITPLAGRRATPDWTQGHWPFVASQTGVTASFPSTSPAGLQSNVSAIAMGLRRAA